LSSRSSQACKGPAREARVLASVDLNRPPDDARILGKLLPPKRIADDHDARLREMREFVAGERASNYRLDAEDLEKIDGDARATCPDRIVGRC
jgi:hypothetical protein